MQESSELRAGFAGTIGNTPLIRWKACRGDGLRDPRQGRVSQPRRLRQGPGSAVDDPRARASGALRPGGTVVEGTAGNTGIGLAHVCNARGYRCVIFMPDTQSPEKVALLETLGAEVRQVPAVRIATR
jgi:cysteine synthase